MNIHRCYPGGKRKALTLSYDDGVSADIRLVGIMRKYGLKGTFNLNSGQAGTGDRLSCEVIADVYRGQEIAAHARTHPHLETLSRRELYAQLYEDRKALEELTGSAVTGMALPYGSWNPAVYEAIRELGFRFNRTVVSTHGFQVPEDFLLWDATCHHADPAMLALTEVFLETDEELALFYLWGHSYEFDMEQNWDLIEAFAARVSGKADIWYAANGEICAYLQDMKRLIVGEDFLINPTKRSLWIEIEDQCREVTPGEWVNL